MISYFADKGTKNSIEREQKNIFILSSGRILSNKRAKMQINLQFSEREYLRNNSPRVTKITFGVLEFLFGVIEIAFGETSSM